MPAPAGSIELHCGGQVRWAGLASANPAVDRYSPSIEMLAEIERLAALERLTMRHVVAICPRCSRRYCATCYLICPHCP